MWQTIESGSRPELADLAARVGSRVEERLRAASLRVGELLASVAPRTSSVTSGFEQEARAVLDSLAGIASGCGFLATPNLFVDSVLSHTWWTVESGSVAIARLDLDESSDSFYDYTAKDFFRLPASTGQMAVDGPYVDYLGTNEYILTWGVPVVLSGAFVGTVGVDVTLQDLQRQLLAMSSARPQPQALVNSRGRVIFSTTAKPSPGSMVRSPDLMSWFQGGTRVPSRNADMEVWPCAGLPWAALALPVPGRKETR